MTESIRSSHRQQSVGDPSERSTRQHKSIINNVSFSIYKSTASQYKQFLSIFEQRLENVYNKENYRIYLNDKTNEKMYQELIKQKNDLFQALEDSKDYKQSANRSLIEEVMNLQRLKEEYDGKRQDYENKIRDKKKDVLLKKKEIKLLQSQIKSYWIYNYDITTTSMNSSRMQSTTLATKDVQNQRYNQDQNKENQASFRKDQNNRGQVNQQNISKQSIKQNTVSLEQDSATKATKQATLHLPTIPNHTRQTSTLRCTSNYTNYQNPHRDQYQQNGTTIILSRDLSLINSSSTRQKLLQKIQQSNKRRTIEKLEYQKEKLKLLKFFRIYLKKSAESQANFTERTRMEKVVGQIEESIFLKEEKLKEIEDLLLERVIGV